MYRSDNMVLGAFLGITLGLYGAYQLAKEPFQIAKEEKIKNQRSNIDVDTICSYMGIKKHNGVYPKYAFDNIERVLRRNFYFRDDEIETMKKKFTYMRNTQLQTQQNNINDKYDELLQEYKSKENNLYRKEYFEVTHWHTIPKEEHEKRINAIYNDKLWHQLCIEPPRLIKNDRKSGYIEIWYIKKPYGTFDKNKYYDTVCKKLGFDYNV